MAETYCGKSCADCQLKEKLNCAGCKVGPGQQYGGDCELARCCRKRDFDACTICNQKAMCGRYHSADAMPTYRLNRQDRLRQEQQTARSNVLLLGKWLPILFWVQIISLLPGFLVTMEDLLSESVVSSVLELLSSVVICGILLRLGAVERCYRRASIYYAVCVVGNFLQKQILDGSAWVMLLSLLASIAGFLAEYNEYVAHSNVVSGVDYSLSENWIKLWKWKLILLCVTIVSGVLTILLTTLSILGAFLVFLGAIGTIVVEIIRIVWLYRMGKIFRIYAKIQEA